MFNDPVRCFSRLVAVSVLLGACVAAESAAPGAVALPLATNTSEVAAACEVSVDRELMIRALSVVDDPIRTGFTGPEDDARTGVWTFAHLMQQMAPSPAEAPAMVEHLLETWLSDQTINQFTVRARPRLQTMVLDSWPRTEDGALDLRRAPLRLQAITNRIDLRNLELGRAGEGRFVFGVLGPTGLPFPFTIILEYRLPASTTADVQRWAEAWHALGALSGEDYNVALQAIIERFAGRDAEPGRPNGSAFGQLRTNENTLAQPWELRQFELSGATGFLEPTTVTLSPDVSFRSGSSVTADFINQNEAEILLEQHQVPASFAGQPFLGGAAPNNLGFWSAPGIADNDARHKFSLNTCDGCHGGETDTTFLHIIPRQRGVVAQISQFLSGLDVTDPVSGEVRNLNDLARRKLDLERIVCVNGGVRAASLPGARNDFLSRGIGRVH